ncbi:hypothetical protein HDR61_02165 [bacterium]|nr:hypothetical protein [bacterium]
MKVRFVILTSLVMVCGGGQARASECLGPECDITPTAGTPTVLGMATERDTITTPQAPRYIAPAQPQYIYAGAIPMRNIKTISVKPVPEDTRRALWDGDHGKYKARTYDKTVDWRDGVPIWDDSIVNYKSKDFSDWYLEPAPEVYLRDIDSPDESIFAQYGTTPAAPTTESIDVIELYNQNMTDAAATRARVEELLTPQRPTENIWADTLVVNNVNDAAPCVQPRPEYVAQDMTSVIAMAFGDGCPFESETECEIWRRKPMIRETVSPRSNKVRPELMESFIARAKCNKNIDASDPTAAPLLDRYKMLMRSAQACCSDGMVYALRNAGASDGLVYKFMADDANFYNLGSRCLMTTDAEFDAKYPNMATAVVAADVRNGCLCRGRQWFTAMLAPFVDAYAAAPEFAQSKFNYTYTDGLQREITVSINNDVQNVLNQLAQCP